MPSFSAPDGTTLVYDAYEPPRPRAAILFVPGWSDHAGRWSWLGRRFEEAGVAAYLLDTRGHGRSGGRRGHLSRFSQLLGDLQAFRRAVRPRTQAPQVLLGHSFGGLVVLRYLESQPNDVLAAIVSSPFLGLAFSPPAWKLFLGRLLADLWPTAGLPAGIDGGALSRDPAVGAAYEGDPLVHDRMTPGAWKEIQWAHRAVSADGHHIERPVLFLLAGEDRVADPHLARAFADGLKAPVEVRWYPEMYHEVLQDPQKEHVVGDVLAYLSRHGIS
jgi:lysophospholipase